MTIKQDIAKIEGLVEALRNEIEVWFEKHFDLEKHAHAKAELHEALGTSGEAAAAPASTPAPVTAAVSSSSGTASNAAQS